MRIAAIVLGAITFLTAAVFIAILGAQHGPEGIGVALAFLFACIPLAVISVVAVCLSFRRRQSSGLDIPARIISIASAVAFVPAGGFAFLLLAMTIFDPTASVPA